MSDRIFSGGALIRMERSTRNESGRMDASTEHAGNQDNERNQDDLEHVVSEGPIITVSMCP